MAARSVFRPPRSPRLRPSTSRHRSDPRGEALRPTRSATTTAGGTTPTGTTSVSRHAASLRCGQIRLRGAQRPGATVGARRHDELDAGDRDAVLTVLCEHAPHGRLQGGDRHAVQARRNALDRRRCGCDHCRYAAAGSVAASKKGILTCARRALKAPGLIADVTTRSRQTMGNEQPRPGTSSDHATFWRPWGCYPADRRRRPTRSSAGRNLTATEASDTCSLEEGTIRCLAAGGGRQRPAG